MSHGKRPTAKRDNASVIEEEIEWFLAVMRRRIQIHSGEAPSADLLAEIAPFPLPPGSRSTDAPYAAVLRRFSMSPVERLVLALAFIPHIRPDLLDPLFIQNV
ncbi:MAG: hypothetical protein ABUS49_08935, partial [Acidobacteriota bacterium]